MGKKIIVKRLIGHFSNLAEHALRPYEPSPSHLKNRLLFPICEDLSDLLEKGTKNDYEQALEGISNICKKFIQKPIKE